MCKAVPWFWNHVVLWALSSDSLRVLLWRHLDDCCENWKPDIGRERVVFVLSVIELFRVWIEWDKKLRSCLSNDSLKSKADSVMLRNDPDKLRMLHYQISKKTVVSSSGSTCTENLFVSFLTKLLQIGSFGAASVSGRMEQISWPPNFHRIELPSAWA